MLLLHHHGWESYYGDRCFLGQLKKKYGEETGIRLWKVANSVFDCLPFAATIDDVIFCVHGGIPRPLSPTTTALESIGSIPCPTAVRAVKGDRKSTMVGAVELAHQ